MRVYSDIELEMVERCAKAVEEQFRSHTLYGGGIVADYLRYHFNPDIHKAPYEYWQISNPTNNPNAAKMMKELFDQCSNDPDLPEIPPHMSGCLCMICHDARDRDERDREGT